MKGSTSERTVEVTDAILRENAEMLQYRVASPLDEGRLVEEICVARDGQEALDDLYEIKLPKVDGLEVLKRIKTDPDLKATPVVTLTTSREERDLLRSYNLVTNACIVRPMSFRFFAETVKEVGLFWGVINQPPSSTAERQL